MSFKCVNKGTPTLFPLVLNAPTNFAMGTPTSTTMPVTWTAPAQGTAIGYKVYEGTTLMKQVDWPATGTTVTGLTNSQSYTFYVVTYEDRGESADSNSDTASTAASPTEPVGDIFNETFESQDMLETNVDGFTWGSNNKTSVVTYNPASVPTACGSYIADTCVAVYNNGAICNTNTCPIDGTYDAFNGDYSLRFLYPASDPGDLGAGQWTEQRFNMGGQYPTMWASYQIKVPTNWNKSNNVQVSTGDNGKLAIFGWGNVHGIEYDTRVTFEDYAYVLETYNSANPPPTGNWNGNNADPTLVTTLRINDTDSDSNSKGGFLAEIDDSYAIDIVQTNDATRSIRYLVSAAVGDLGTYHEFTVTYASQGAGGTPVVGQATLITTHGANEFRVEVKDWPDTLDPSAMECGLQVRSMSDINGHEQTFRSFDGGNYHDFITEADQGRWMHVVFDFTASTDIDTSDGHVRMYRKWEDESTYTTIGVIEGIAMATGGRGATGWGYGYLMGFVNQEYFEETEWFIDNIRFSTSDLRIT